jgi:hypothetical protein
MKILSESQEELEHLQVVFLFELVEHSQFGKYYMAMV